MRVTPLRCATVVCLCLLVHGCGGDAPSPGTRVLAFTAVPDQNTTELQEKFQPLVAFLSRRLGVPVEYVPVKGETDPRYFSYFIAHADTGLKRSDEFPSGIAGLSFTFGSRSSTSGRLMPEHFIRQSSGLSPEEFFGRTVGFSGSHDKTAELVESGQYEAGVINYKVYDRRVAEGKTDPDVARVIWKTPVFADYSWTAHPHLEETFGDGFVSRLQETLVSIDDPALLSALPRERLIEASNEDFESIRQVAVELGMLR